MGIIINKHVKVQQVKMLEKAVVQCDKMIEKMELDLKNVKKRKSSLMDQLKIQGKAVEKEQKDREKAQESMEKRKEAAEKKAADVPKIKNHPDSKKPKVVEEKPPVNEEPPANMEMKKDDLIIMAEELGLEVEKSMNKEQLIEMINKK